MQDLSQTLPTPTAVLTNSDSSNSPFTASSSPAVNVRSSHPYLPANCDTAASPALISMVDSAFTAAGSIPLSSSASRTRRSRTSGCVPFLQPTPTTTIFGTRRRKEGLSLFRNVIHMLCPHTLFMHILCLHMSLAPSAPWHSESQKKPTSPPSSSQAEISLASFLSVMQRPFRAAKISTANTPLTSVAVVMTGMPLSQPAILSASSLAPPTWPDNRGMQKCPASSAATTGGSVILSRT